MFKVFSVSIVDFEQANNFWVKILSINEVIRYFD